MNTKQFIKKCGNDVACVEKLLEEIDCEKCNTFKDKHECYNNILNIKKTFGIDLDPSMQDFHRTLLPEVLGDMMTHCNRKVKNGHGLVWLKLNNPSLDPNTKAGAIHYYSNYQNFGIERNGGTFYIDCFKLSKKLSEHNIPIFNGLSNFSIAEC